MNDFPYLSRIQIQNYRSIKKLDLTLPRTCVQSQNLQRTEAKLLAIEELENAIHPWAIEVLLEKIQERQNRQIILTTHSVEVVNAIKDPNILFVCENSAKGTTITKAINKESALVEMMSESGERLGDVWNAGSIGGVPLQV